MNAVGTPRRGLIWLVFGLAFLGTSAVPLPAQQWVTETRDPKQTQDEDFAKAYASGPASQVRQPPGRPPAAGAGHPDAKGHPGPPRRRAPETDVLRGHAEVLPRAGRGDAARKAGHDRTLR
jgi:hypothetical protein